jgi:hypothetical protein
MFRIEFFVNDNKLGPALQALVGLAVGDPKVQPVINATTASDKITAINSGSLEDQFRRFAKLNKLSDRLQADTFKQFARSVGRSTDSYGYFIKRLIDLGLIKKFNLGKGNVHVYYKVVA